MQKVIIFFVIISFFASPAISNLDDYEDLMMLRKEKNDSSFHYLEKATEFVNGTERFCYNMNLSLISAVEAGELLVKATSILGDEKAIDDASKQLEELKSLSIGKCKKNI